MRPWQDAITVARMRQFGRALGWALLCLAGFVPFARAFDVHLDSDTSFQAYDVRSPRAGAYLTRSRLTQNVAFQVVQPLADDPAEGPKLSTVVQLRLDHDFGETCLVGLDACFGDSDAAQPGVYQPWRNPSFIDAPTAYVELAGLLSALRLRAGRQMVWDTLEARRMDGAHVRMGAVDWMAVDGYFGALVRGNSLLGNETFSPESKARRDLDGVNPAAVPYIDSTTQTWIAGGALELGEPHLVRARLSAQELWESSGIVARRLGLSLSSQPLEVLRLSANGGWDLLDGTLFRAQAGANLDFEDWGSDVSAERRVPRFDWGSIWAYFDVAPIDEARLGGYVQVSRWLRLSAALRGRQAHLDEQTDRDLGGEAAALITVNRLKVDVSGFLWDGDMGPLSGALLYVSHPLGHRLSLFARGSLWQFDDPYQDVLEGVSISEMLGTKWQITPQSSVMVEVTHSTNEVVGHRWRGLAMLNVEAWR